MTTNRDPLTIRAYPSYLSRKVREIPRGSTITIICDCIQQEYRKSVDWLYVGYIEDGKTFNGWVNKKYVTFI